MGKDWIITKRLLGLAIVAAGVVAGIGIVLLDAIRGASDFGPTQQLGVVAAVALVIFGLTLLPLGDRPA